MLDGALRARGITTLVVTGTMTDICVLATVMGGFNREYRMVVVEDGVATMWPGSKTPRSTSWAARYARVDVARTSPTSRGLVALPCSARPQM